MASGHSLPRVNLSVQDGTQGGFHSYSTTFGDGSRSFEPWSSDKDDTGAGKLFKGEPRPLKHELKMRSI
ncbi:hypothetical protein TNCV_2613811 [Trichonephila clavipes]|nr:hypothetical protein TNCV_2613811 [Trichonephila clavipes]